MGLRTKFTDVAPGFEKYAQLLGTLNDDQLGPVGQRLVETLMSHNCQITAQNNGPGTQQQQNLSQNQIFTASALYVPFTYIDMPPDKRLPGSPATFTNLLVVYDNGVIERSAVEVAHETNHAELWNLIPALHASSFNGVNPAKPDIVASPRSEILSILKTEGLGYAYQGLIGSIGVRTNSVFNDVTRSDALKPEQFQKIRDESPNLKTAMVRAARAALDSWHHTENGQDITFGQYYAGYALSLLELSPRLKNPEGVTFVGMKDSDYHKHGRALSLKVLRDPNYIGENDIDKYLTNETRAQLAEQDARFGTGRTTQSFTRACAHFNLTPTKFMAISKAQNQPTPGVFDPNSPELVH